MYSKVQRLDTGFVFVQNSGTKIAHVSKFDYQNCIFLKILAALEHEHEPMSIKQNTNKCLNLKMKYSSDIVWLHLARTYPTAQCPFNQIFYQIGLEDLQMPQKSL